MRSVVSMAEFLRAEFGRCAKLAQNKSVMKNRGQSSKEAPDRKLRAAHFVVVDESIPRAGSKLAVGSCLGAGSLAFGFC
jgi:hypothetical protein